MNYDFVSGIDPIALWGAALSTVLAVREFLNTRTKIEIGFNFTGDCDGIGNEIFIRNLSNKPILITWWNLSWCRRSWFRLNIIDALEPDEYFSDFVIPALSSHKLSFSGASYFDSSLSLYENGGIFIDLAISGKKRMKRFKVIGD